MDCKINEVQKTMKNNINLTVASSELLPDLIEIASKAFGDSATNTSTWLQKMMKSPSHQVYIAFINEKQLERLPLLSKSNILHYQDSQFILLIKVKDMVKIFLVIWYIHLLQKEFQQLN